MSTTYTPHPDSLPGKVVAFFRDNSDETLTLDDVVTKWNATRNNIHTQLGRAITERILMRERSADGEYIYCAGPRLNNGEAPKAKPVEGKPKGSTSVRLHFDIDSVQVEDDVPFTAAAQKGQGKWDPLFEKLTKVGQSAAIPAEIKKAVAAAAIKRNKEKRGTYRVQLTSANEARVWRVA